MLEQSEIDLLTKSKEEIYRATREIFAEEKSIRVNQKIMPSRLGSSQIAPITEPWPAHLSTWSLLTTSRSHIPGGQQFGVAVDSGEDNVSDLRGKLHATNQDKTAQAIKAARAVRWVNGLLNVIRL